MNQWQKEILKLEKLNDKNINRNLFNAYNDALKDVRKKLKVYMEDYKDLPYYKQQQTGKLLALEKEIVDLLNASYPKAKYELTEFKQKELEDGYYSTMYQLEGETGASLDFMGLDKEFVSKTIANPIGGKTLSKRLYSARTKLANRATSELRNGMMMGLSYGEIAKAIQGHTEANYKQAMRIARTEGGRLRSLAKQEAYTEAKAMGIDLQKRWCSSMDRRTRSSHQQLDGQTVGVDDDFVSPLSGAKGPGPRLLGRASEDINCRCTTITIVDGIAPDSRYAKNDDGHGYEKIKYKSFNEWKKVRLTDTGQSTVIVAKDIMSKTNMLETFGENNYSTFTENLATVPDERMAKLYEKYGSDLVFEKVAEGKERYSGQVFLSQSSFKGNSTFMPLEMVYHENAHSFDRRGVKSITGDKNFKTGNKMKIKGYKGKMFEVDEEITLASALPQYNLKQTVHDDLWRYVNDDLPTYDSLGKAPRKKADRELYDKMRSDIYAKNRVNMANFKENMLKLSEKNPYVTHGISDIVESTGYLGEYPFGSGHGKNYWKTPGMAETEFFAHVSESISTNPEAYKLMQEIFPNAITTWETIVDDMIKGAD